MIMNFKDEAKYSSFEKLKPYCDKHLMTKSIFKQVKLNSIKMKQPLRREFCGVNVSIFWQVICSLD